MASLKSMPYESLSFPASGVRVLTFVPWMRRVFAAWKSCVRLLGGGLDVEISPSVMHADTGRAGPFLSLLVAQKIFANRLRQRQRCTPYVPNMSWQVLYNGADRVQVRPGPW